MWVDRAKEGLLPHAEDVAPEDQSDADLEEAPDLAEDTLENSDSLKSYSHNHDTG